MADIRIHVPDKFMSNLRQELGLRENAEVVQEALTLLGWAVGEIARGRLMLSTNKQGKEVERLVMRSLSTVEAVHGRP